MNGLGQFVTKSYDKTPVKQRKEKMATGKGGAGPYAGYKKNYSPIKSSKGTKAEKVVGKVLSAAGGGVKPQKVKVGGKTMTTKPVESGLGVVGAMAKAVARTAARNAGKSVKGPSPARVKAIRKDRSEAVSNFREWEMGGRDIPISNRTLKREAKEDLGRGAGGTLRDSGVAKRLAARKARSDRAGKEIARAGELMGASVRGKGTMSDVVRKISAESRTNSARNTKVPVKGRTSPTKGKK